MEEVHLAQEAKVGNKDQDAPRVSLQENRSSGSAEGAQRNRGELVEQWRGARVQWRGARVHGKGARVQLRGARPWQPGCSGGVPGCNGSVPGCNGGLQHSSC